MVQYDLIKNEKLRQLVMVSEVIRSLDDSARDELIKSIIILPLEGQVAMIDVLEDEQLQIAEAKKVKGITPEMDLQKMNAQMLKVHLVKKNFQTKVRNGKEQKERAQSAAFADNLLL